MLAVCSRLITKGMPVFPSPDDYLIYENAHFRAEQSVQCTVPGYLIVSAKYPVASLTSLGIDALQALGPTLAVVDDVRT
jgi:diadenosine tetraphosphate (Ap4A) HIT family hydrolase